MAGIPFLREKERERERELGVTAIAPSPLGPTSTDRDLHCAIGYLANVAADAADALLTSGGH